MGADDHHRPAARRRRVRRARARAVAPPADAVAARVRRRRVGVGGRREPARRRALVGGVRRRRAHRGRHRAAGQGSAPAHPLRWALGRDRPGRPRRPRPRRSPSGPTRRSSRAPRCCASRSASRARRSRGGIAVDGGGWAADLLAAAADVATAPAGAPTGSSASCAATRPRRWPGSASSTRPASAAASPSTWASARRRRCSRTCSPAPATGPALVIAPPAVVGNWAAEAARFTPESARRRAPRRATAPRADEIAAEVADADVVVTTYGTAVRDVDALAEVAWARVVLDEAQAIKNPANDTSQQLRRIPAPQPHRAHRHADRERPRRPLGDPRLHQPRPRRPAAAVHRAPLERRHHDARRRRRRDARAQRHPRVPPHEGRARDRGRAARPDRRARPLRDDPRADRPVPGGARHAGDRHRSAPRARSRARVRSSPRSPRSSRSATTRRRTSTTTGRSPAARASSPGSRRSSTRCSRPASGCWCSPTSPSGACGSPSTSPSAPARRSTCYHGGLSRTARDQLIEEFQTGEGPGALVLSLKAGGTGLNLTAASHVVLYDRWWNPAVEDQARDRAWRIGQTRTVICHRLVCPGTVDERVEEVVAGKRRIADLVLPKSSSLADLDSDQLRAALGIRPDAVLTEDLHGRRAGRAREPAASPQGAGAARTRAGDPRRNATSGAATRPTRRRSSASARPTIPP